jgi:hypothetical protein
MSNIKIKIDVSKINKSRLYEGKKGTWLNAVMIEKKTEYSDFMIVQEVTAEERQQQVNGTIIGNGMYLKAKDNTRKDNTYTKPPKDNFPF